MECKERLAKKEALASAKATGRGVRSVRAELFFLDKELALAEFNDEDMAQPCTQGDRCSQEYCGYHNKECYEDNFKPTEREPGQDWGSYLAQQPGIE